MHDRFGALVAALVGRLLERRKLSLLAAALVVGALALVGRRLELDEDLAAFLPLDDPRIQEQLSALRAFRGLDTLRVDLSVGDPAATGSASETERASLHAAAAAFEAALDPTVAPLISRVASGPSPGALAALEDLVRRSLPSLVEPDAVERTLARFDSDEAVDALLAQHVLTLNGLEGPFVKEHVRRDPLGLESDLFASLASLGTHFGGARLENGRIVSADDRHALLVVEPSVPSSRTEDAERVLALLGTATAKAREAAGVPVSAVFVGGHRSSVENARAIKRDAWLTSLVSLAAMLVVYAWVFPRRWLIPLTALPLAAGGVIGTAVTQLVLGRVSAIALGFGGILLGLADDFIVLLYSCFETRSLERARRGEGPDPRLEAVGRVARPLVAAGAAIAAAFLALAVSGLRGQRDLAVFATASLAGTLLATLLVHPLVLPEGASPRPLRDTAAPLRAFVRAVERRRGLALVLALVATLALGLAALRLRFADDPRAIDGSSREARAAEDTLARDFGDQRGASLVIARGTDLDAALEQREKALVRLESLVREGRLASVLRLPPLCPTRATQERRRAGWRATFTPERRAAFAERFARLAPRHHFSARAFEPFFARLATDGDPVDVLALAKGPLADLLPRIVVDASGARALSLAFPVPGSAPDAAWPRDLERETGVLVGTFSGLARDLVAAIRARLWRCGALAGAVVLAILLPALGSARRTLAAALALTVGLVWSLGLLALLGAALNPVNFLIPVLVFGLAVDDAILLATAHAATAEQASGVLESEAHAGVFASSATTLAGIASLLLASHPAVFSVGLVALVGTAATFLATVVVIPALLGRS